MNGSNRIRLCVRVILAGLLTAWGSDAALACSTCGCTLNSEWQTQGYTTGAGLRVQLRVDYFNADELRAGTGTLDRSQPANQPGPDQDSELQHQTRNWTTTLTVDYAASSNWGVAVLLPFIDRYHSTYPPGDTVLSESHGGGVGDVRLIGRYQGFSDSESTGVLFGLKLPTGKYNQVFDAGPASQAEPPDNLLDRGLQRGTGTTDAILGGYNFGAIAPRWGYFVQAFVQRALNTRDEFRPGDSLNVNLGARYTGWKLVKPQLQLNLRAERREEGANADADNSGLAIVNLTPGVAAPVTPGVELFAFVSVPLYRHVNGIQMLQRYNASVGATFSF